MIVSLEDLPLPWLIGAFVLCAGVILFAGKRLAGNADLLADRTGLGEALIGAVLLGGSTSLPGIVASVTAAAQGHAALAISNAIGGIAVQFAFLALADITYRKANLEHAVASMANLGQVVLLTGLLAAPLLAAAGRDITLWQVHPVSAAMLVGYLAGLALLRRVREQPMWHPRRTPQTIEDKPEPDRGPSARRLWLEFAGLAATVALAGYAISQLSIEIADRTGLSQTAVGTALTAVATSLPELVTAIAAVRAGALTLAVGNVVGGNAFDTLFLALSDVAYREGSLYASFAPDDRFLVAVTILMAAVLMLGLVRREPKGFASIGFESALILALYALSIANLFL